MGGRTHRRRDLLGTTQAALIDEMIQRADLARRDRRRARFAVGPPPVFQGSERDIMLVSMVLGRGDRACGEPSSKCSSASTWPRRVPATG